MEDEDTLRRRRVARAFTFLGFVIAVLTIATIHTIIVTLAVAVLAVTVHVVVVILIITTVLTITTVVLVVAVLVITSGFTIAILTTVVLQSSVGAAFTLLRYLSPPSPSPSLSLFLSLSAYPPHSQLLGSQRRKGAPARPAMSLAGAPGPRSEALHAPGSASAQVLDITSAASTACFVELSPVNAMQPAEFHDALVADPAVSRVVCNSTKTSHGNTGSRYVEQSLLVHVQGFPGKPLEFELARHEHEHVACFKPPPTGMGAVAWQILMRVVKGKELMPEWARQYAHAEQEARLRVTRLSKDEVAGLTISLAAEWKAILTNLDGSTAVGTPPPGAATVPGVLKA